LIPKFVTKLRSLCRELSNLNDVFTLLKYTKTHLRTSAKSKIFLGETPDLRPRGRREGRRGRGRAWKGGVRGIHELASPWKKILRAPMTIA
jgi:hypothetical protein